MNAQLKLIDSKFKRGDKLKVRNRGSASYQFVKVDPTLDVVWLFHSFSGMLIGVRASAIELPEVPKAKPGVRYNNGTYNRIGMANGRLGYAKPQLDEVDYDPCVWREVK